MTRKAAATVAHATLSIVTPPATVAEAKRNRRAKRAPAAAAPAPTPVVVDLSQPNARKVLAAAYPRPTNETMVEASEAQEIAAATYLAARDRATAESARKEAAGTVLINAIRENLGIEGNGWKATWNTKKGDIDWSALVKELAIDSATIKRFRKPSYRVIDVRETIDESEVTT